MFNDLVKIVEELGWSSDQFISFINLESTKEALKLNTEELAKRGGFGSPTMFVDGKNMFFGNDRLNLCLLYTSPSPRDRQKSRMPSSA